MTTRSPRRFFDTDAPGSKAVLNVLGEAAVFDSDSATKTVVFTRRSDRDYRTRRVIYIDEMRAQESDVAKSRRRDKVTRSATGQRFELSEFVQDSTGWLRWRITEFHASS